MIEEDNRRHVVLFCGLAVSKLQPANVVNFCDETNSLRFIVQYIFILDSLSTFQSTFKCYHSFHHNPGYLSWRIRSWMTFQPSSVDRDGCLTLCTQISSEWLEPTKFNVWEIFTPSIKLIRFSCNFQDLGHIDRYCIKFKRIYYHFRTTSYRIDPILSSFSVSHKFPTNRSTSSQITRNLLLLPMLKRAR